MPDDGFHLRLQEGVATGIVTHGRQFFLQQRTGVYPPNQGLDGTLGSVAWLVEQSQFGLAIGTDLEHVWCMIDDVWCMIARNLMVTKIRNYNRHSKYFLFFFALKRTKTDINGQKRTWRLREVLSLHCDSSKMYDLWCMMSDVLSRRQSYIKHQTLSIKHHTSSIIHQTSYIKHHKSLTLKLNKNYGKISNLFSSPSS